MAKSFEEMPVWNKSRELVKFVYGITKSKEFSKDFSLTDQIRRAAVSVMSNLVEGFERGSNTEFVQFLYIAKGSCGEVRTQLYAAWIRHRFQMLTFNRARNSVWIFPDSSRD